MSSTKITVVGLAYHSKVDIDFEDDSAVSAGRTIRGQGPAAGGLTLHFTRYFRIIRFPPSHR